MEDKVKVSAPLSAVLAALVTLATAPAVIAKLPPGAAFEACGASGCKTTTTDDEAFQLQLTLIEPTMERGTIAAPPGPQAWIRLDLKRGSIRGAPGREALRWYQRDFPVVFSPSANRVGVPRNGREYRWVPLSFRQSAALTQVAAGVRPFTAKTLADLDPATVARVRVKASAAEATAGTDDATPPTLLIALLVAAAFAMAAGLATRARHVRHSPAEGEPA